jgi:hypothetical protein
MSPITRLIDRLGTRNRDMNRQVVGIEAATYAARCVIWALLVALLAGLWAVVYVLAVATNAGDLAALSVVILLLFGLPIAWLAFRSNNIAARLAADHYEPVLGFRPRWWMCYSAPRGWTGAIERQKRWHARRRWPLIPW